MNNMDNDVISNILIIVLGALIVILMILSIIFLVLKAKENKRKNRDFEEENIRG